MKATKLKVAEALFPILSAFHEVNGLQLKIVRQKLAEECLVSLVLDFDSKALLIKAHTDDDTVEFEVANSFTLEQGADTDVSLAHPWQEFIGQEFGWGWVSVNQQGYLDGLLLSFGGIMPQLLLTVVASSLKILRVKAAT